SLPLPPHQHQRSVAAPRAPVRDPYKMPLLRIRRGSPVPKDEHVCLVSGYVGVLIKDACPAYTTHIEPSQHQPPSSKIVPPTRLHNFLEEGSIWRGVPPKQPTSPQPSTVKVLYYILEFVITCRGERLRGVPPWN